MLKVVRPEKDRLCLTVRQSDGQAGRINTGGRSCQPRRIGARVQLGGPPGATKTVAILGLHAQMSASPAGDRSEIGPNSGYVPAVGIEVSLVQFHGNLHRLSALVFAVSKGPEQHYHFSKGSMQRMPLRWSVSC